MIEWLQTGARNAVKVMEGGVKNATESVAQAGLASNSLNEITTISVMNSQVASAANEQYLSASEINRQVLAMLSSD